MGNLKSGKAIIYESPDNGETVYGRYIGESNRWVVGQSTNAQVRVNSINEDKLWGEIRRAAKSNPALQKALDRAIIIYQIVKIDD